MKTKVCGKCKRKLSVSNFSRGISIGRLFYWCKICAKKHNQLYHKTHKKEIAQRKRLWAELNKEQIQKYMKIYREAHKKDLKEYDKIQYKYSKEKRKINKRNRRKIDINFKILCYLRTRIWYALKRNLKSATTIELTGCSVEKLKSHLQSKFTSGMSWKNYGRWHVDHIKPCASFDLSKASEQKKCFNYTNLQPLWAKDNLKKNDTQN